MPSSVSMPHSSKLHEQNVSEELNNLVKEDDFWLNTHKTDETGKHLSWTAYRATKDSEIGLQVYSDISQLLPMWMDDSKSTATIKHTMDIIRRAVSFLNPGQVPVVAFDQPLITIAKSVQWLCPKLYGEGK